MCSYCSELGRSDWRKVFERPTAQIAYIHWSFQQEHQRGPTLIEARVLHAPFFPNIQGSASLFGRELGKKILYRNVDYRTMPEDGQEVLLTEEGVRQAMNWRHYKLGLPLESV
jgi:hypothetical protein